MLAEIEKELGIKLPHRYQVVGHVALIKLIPNHSEEACKRVSELLMKRMKRIRTVCFVEGIEGELRVPKIKYIFGDGTETIHREHGILYKLDVSKIMFSKGNLNERKRMAEIVGDGETVVDMFAGIGYFSLGIAKSHPKTTVYAIEKNPTAFRYLKENINLNKLNNVIPILGDNREQNLPPADRIIMGYFPGTENFLSTALKYVKSGGTIHYHNTYKKEELWSKPEEELKVLRKFEIISRRKVKSVAPNTFHVVLDVRVWK